MEWMKEAVDYVIFGILGLMGLGLCLRGGARHCAHEELHDALHHLLERPLRRAARHGDRHHAHVLRHGQHGRDRRGSHHDGPLPCAQGHGARSGRRDSDAHLLQRPAARDERRLKAQGLTEESS